MNFSLTKNAGYSVIKANVDKLNALNAPELKELINTLGNESINNIIIDLSATSYSNSSGLSSLLAANRLCKNTNGKFILSGLQPNVRKMIEIAQLHRVITITDSLAEAEKMM